METSHGQVSAQARRRLQAGELILRGFSNDEIVEITEASLTSVKRWRATIQSEGLQGLARKPQSGRPTKLDATRKAELKTLILGGAIAAGPIFVTQQTDRWTTKIVADLIVGNIAAKCGASPIPVPRFGAFCAISVCLVKYRTSNRKNTRKSSSITGVATFGRNSKKGARIY